MCCREPEEGECVIIQAGRRGRGGEEEREKERYQGFINKARDQTDGDREDATTQGPKEKRKEQQKGLREPQTLFLEYVFVRVGSPSEIYLCRLCRTLRVHHFNLSCPYASLQV